MKKITRLLLLAFLFTNSVFAITPNTSYGIRVNDTLPSIKQVSNITVGIKRGHTFDDSFSGWKSAMSEAIFFLNIVAYDSGSSVKFKWTGKSSADVLLEYSTLNKKTIARTNIGDKHHGVGKRLRINRDYHKTLKYYEKVKVLKHELLHTIGFRHSRTKVEINDGSVEVPNTDNFWEWQYYGNSIMQIFNNINDIPQYLSELDRRALGTIFPK